MRPCRSAIKAMLNVNDLADPTLYVLQQELLLIYGGGSPQTT